MSVILTSITKRYGDTVVVNNVSLEVKDGELFVLLGRSGSGKSTVLRMIAGLTLPDAGQIELHGREVTGLAPQARGVGFVFQNYSIFRHMTVAGNIEFGLRIRNVSAEERRQRSEELLDLVGLSGLGSRFADQLSGGQQQRVALARALAYQPEVLLLDEPFGALDVKIRAQLRQSLKDVQEQLHVTTILVTHDQEEAFELAHRIGVIERGSLVEVAEPETLYHMPKTEFAASFVGSGNVLVGKVEGGQIKLGSIDLPLPDNAPLHDEGSPARVLFRPETVLVASDRKTLDRDVYTLGQGRIAERIFVGSQQRLRIDVEGLLGSRTIVPSQIYGQRMTQIEALQPSLTPAGNMSPGSLVWVGIKNFHVLGPAGLKVLISSNLDVAEEAGVSFGAALARAAGAPTTLMSVLEPGRQVAEAMEKIEDSQRKFFGSMNDIETKIRQGKIAEEILLEAQEGHYEVVVLTYPAPDLNLTAGGIGSIARQILVYTETPVLLVREARQKIDRILICTAAGEPGKSDVRFGGRIARRTGASATVLHVRRPQATFFERKSVERHIRQSQRSLEALGIESQSLIIEDTPLVDGIIHEAARGDYDLLVIGAPSQPSAHQAHWSDVASQIVREAAIPVLVVPMTE